MNNGGAGAPTTGAHNLGNTSNIEADPPAVANASATANPRGNVANSRRRGNKLQRRNNPLTEDIDWSQITVTQTVTVLSEPAVLEARHYTNAQGELQLCDHVANPANANAESRYQCHCGQVYGQNTEISGPLRTVEFPLPVRCDHTVGPPDEEGYAECACGMVGGTNYDFQPPLKVHVDLKDQDVLIHELTAAVKTTKLSSDSNTTANDENHKPGQQVETPEQPALANKENGKSGLFRE